MTKEIITPQRLKWAIDSFQPFESLGVDGFFSSQRRINDFLLYVVELARNSLATRYISRTCGNSLLKLGEKMLPHLDSTGRSV